MTAVIHQITEAVKASARDLKASGKYTYLEQQLMRAAPLPLTEDHYPYGIDIQFSSPYGKTNFLKLSVAQMRKLEDALFGQQD